MHSWSYVAIDPALPSRWRWGTIHESGPGWASDLMTGAVPCRDGRRLGYVFDHENDDRSLGCVAAVRRVAAVAEPLELRTQPPALEVEGLNRVDDAFGRVVHTGPTGADARRGPEVPRAVEKIRSDVSLVWFEDIWVLGRTAPGSSPERLEDLLLALGEVAVELDESAAGSAPNSLAT